MTLFPARVSAGGGELLCRGVIPAGRVQCARPARPRPPPRPCPRASCDVCAGGGGGRRCVARPPLLLDLTSLRCPPGPPIPARVLPAVPCLLCSSLPVPQSLRERHFLCKVTSGRPQLSSSGRPSARFSALCFTMQMLDTISCLFIVFIVFCLLGVCSFGFLPR